MRSFETGKTGHPIEEVCGFDAEDPVYRVWDEPMCVASRKGHVACIKRMVERGADINVVSEMDNTPLLEALWNNQRECAYVLLDLGADVNAYGGTRVFL